MHHSIFTDDEEQSIADFIRINIISNHYHFTDRNFILSQIKLIQKNAKTLKIQKNST